jgi:hypothetical protein
VDVAKEDLDTVIRLTEIPTNRSEPTGPAAGSSAQPVVPDYGGACISSLLPELTARNEREPAKWLPAECIGTRQLVMLVLDGIGWEQLVAGRHLAPCLAEGRGGPITSVAPTTTATALTSLTTGSSPSEHGVVGYRLRLDPDGFRRGEGADAHATNGGRGPVQPSAGHVSESNVSHRHLVLNVLKWRTALGDMRRLLPAAEFQPLKPFGGERVPAVTRNEFASTGFTALHLGGARLVGWSVPSSLVVHVRDLLRAGEPFIYVYYDGLDKVAHAYGLGDFYRQELRFVDSLVADILEVLPSGCALVLTSDHGQVEVGQAARLPEAALFDHVEMLSGEGRFRWLHARQGAADDLLEVAREAHSEEAWVLAREEVIDQGWYGGKLPDEVQRRLGDVALVAREATAFLDPADTGETRLAGRHGSLTASEMFVPLLAWAAS